MHTQEEITTAALALPFQERMELAATLLEQAVHAPDVPKIVHAAEQACGVEMDAACRFIPYVQARCIVAYALHKAGLSDRAIAPVINKDRCTVIYSRRQMRDALAFPGSNLPLVHKYAKFNELLYATD